MSDDVKKYDPWDPKGHLAALYKRMDENDKLDEDIPITVFLSKEAGSDPAVVAQIAEAVNSGNPFGLRGEGGMVVFVPDKRKAYLLSSDYARGPVIGAKNDRKFMEMIALQYLVYKELIDQDRLLLICEMLNYANKLKYLESVRNENVSESTEPAGQVEAGDRGVRPRILDGCEAIYEHYSAITDAVVLSEPVQPAKDVPEDGSQNLIGNGG